MVLFKYVWLLIYGSALGVILLGSMGLVDKRGALERSANKIISNSTGLSMEQLEELEGVKLDDKPKKRSHHCQRRTNP